MGLLVIPQPLALAHKAPQPKPSIALAINLSLGAAPDKAIQVPVKPRPNFDAEVLVPLRAAQAEAAAQAAAEAARQAAEAQSAQQAPPQAQAAPAPVYGGSASGILAAIMHCESGGNYTAQNPSSTASGAYQFLDSTWAGYGGYSRAMYAPPSVQDQYAQSEYAADGTAPWLASRGCWGR